MHTDAVGHIPVLLDQVVELLSPAPGETVLDCTLGRGGHAAALMPRIPGGAYVGIDVDPANAEFARKRLEPIAAEHGVELVVVADNFARVVDAAEHPSLVGGVDMLLADLGFASNQMDDPARGLAFSHDGPLDMRLAGPAPGDGDGDAASLVNTLPETALADLIYRYGEERLSRRIARKIVERRSESPIKTTKELADICRRAYPPPRAKGGRGIHPATRTFQALRIAVNGELQALSTLLERLPQLLKPRGRAAVIAFHSLEDRPVKESFLKMQQDGLAQRLTRKPITAGPEETTRNPRSRSAKLRGLRRT